MAGEDGTVGDGAPAGAFETEPSNELTVQPAGSLAGDRSGRVKGRSR